MRIKLSRRQMLTSSLAGMAMAVQAGADRVSQVLDTSLDDFVDDLRRRSRVPGVSVAFLKQGELAWHRQFGYADRNRRILLKPDTLIQAASLTKPTFAAVFMRLCEDGVCDLDKPVMEVLTDFQMTNDPRGKQITPRHLLSHTSGLPLTHAPEWPVELESSPASVFSYSGAGYMCLQMLAEFCTRQPLDQIMQQYLVAPLGWKHSCYVTPTDGRRAAVGYEWNGRPVRPPGLYENANAAASLHTTAFEYLEFVRRLLLPGNNGLLKAETLHKMVAPQVRVTPGIEWGLGWGIHSDAGRARLFHWGDSRGFMHYAAVDQSEGTALVVLTNGRHGLRLCEEVAARTMGSRERNVFDWIYRGFYEAAGTPIPPWPR